MNTDACDVEDINILHIKECLLLSCVASFEDWSNIFRTRSFTLCKNDLDFHDMSDSATVLESISSFSTMNLSVCCENKPDGCSLTSLTVLTLIRFPLLRLVNILLWVTWGVSVLDKSPRSLMLLSPRAQKYMTFTSGVHRALWCSRGKHVRIPFAASRDQIHYRLRLLWLFLHLIFWVLFDITSEHSVKLKWLMLNKHKRWFITCEISLGLYVCE